MRLNMYKTYYFIRFEGSPTETVDFHWCKMNSVFKGYDFHQLNIHNCNPSMADGHVYNYKRCH